MPGHGPQSAEELLRHPRDGEEEGLHLGEAVVVYRASGGFRCFQPLGPLGSAGHLRISGVTFRVLAVGMSSLAGTFHATQGLGFRCVCVYIYMYTYIYIYKLLYICIYIFIYGFRALLTKEPGVVGSRLGEFASQVWFECLAALPCAC